MFIRNLFLIVLVFGSISVAAYTPEKKPVLRVATSINSGFTNQDNTGLYWQIIEEIFKDHYQIEKITTQWEQAIALVSSGKADILLGITNKDNEQLIYSTSHINKTYPIYAFYHKDRFTFDSFTDLDNLSIALRQGSSIDRLLKNKNNIYQVESIYHVDKLILNQRVDIALAYSYNTHLVSPENLINNQEIISEQSVHLAFTNNSQGKALQSKFDKAMYKAIDEDRLATLFPNELDYQHALYSQNNSDKTIQWNLTPKLYNKNTKRLEVLKREVDYSKYIIEQLPEYHFTLNTKARKQSQNNETSKQTACSFNIKRNETQINSLYFSNPAHVFIKPKLFFLDKSPTANLIKPIKDNQEININELIANNPYLQISIRKNASIHKNLARILSPSVLSKLHIVDELNYKNMMSLLLADRISGFIAWPTMVSELLDNKKDIELIRSVSIEENIGKSLFSYITCTKSIEGKVVIDKINQVLSDPNHHQALFQQTLNQLDQDSQSQFIKLMNLSL